MNPGSYTRITMAVIGTALLGISPPPVAAQAAKVPPSAGKKRKLPRTPAGQPDLQGFWTNASLTPLERPAELASKEFFTEEEAAAFERQRLLRENSQAANDIHYDNVTWQTENYAKVVSNRRTSIIFDPPDGKVPPLSPEGQKRAVLIAEAARRRNAAESAESRSLAERCISWGNEGPPMIPATYNNNLEIFQSGDSIVIHHEMIHGVRFIPLDGRPHLPAGIRQLDGDSRGHWQGDTLIVDTTNFTDETPFRGAPAITRQDIFSSRNLHVVERFSLLDGDTILYRFTVEDPSTWAKPWSGELLMRRTQGPIFEYACHEGNYGLVNILAGARAAEKAAAEAAQ